MQGEGYSAGNIIAGSEGGLKLVGETVKHINQLWENTDVGKK